MVELASPETSLAAHLQSKRVTAEQAALFSAQIGEELAAAHAAGLVYGNLTSRCISLRGDSSGLRAVLAAGKETLEAADIEQLAPEVRSGAQPTVSADVYSFGKILDQIRNAVSGPDPRSIGWQQTIRRCLDPDPAHRPSSILDVVQAIGLPADLETAAIASIEPASQGATRWGEFQLLQRLGQGAFGEVYRAWDPVLEREVALKLLLPRGLDPEEEFLAIVAEARAIARVRHPNVVSVYGVDRRDGRVGFWSDFVHGRTLSQIVETEGPLSLKEAAEAGAALCAALTAVHHAGLLHRDVKASNAMRDENGAVLLMDFGLSQESHRATGIAGTPTYMAPELIAGHGPTVQSDLYAVGILLLFLCTGGYPPAGNGSADDYLAKHEIPPALQQIIRKAISPEPRQRHRSALELREALMPLVSDTITARRKAKRRRSIAWAAACLVVLCLGAAMVPQFRVLLRPKTPAANSAAYQDFLSAEDALVRYDKPGNTEKAIALYKTTLARSPNFALAEAGLANAAWRMYLDTSNQKWADQANAAAARAAAMNSNLGAVQMTLGTIHVGEGKFGLGMQELQQAQQLDPMSADVHGAIAEAYRQENRIDDAKKEFQTAIDLAPNDWRWPYLLGAVQIDSGNFPAAESNLKTALEKTPDNARVLYNLGLDYEKENRFPEAQKALEDALRLDPREVTMMALGSVLMLEGKYREAVARYRLVLDQDPESWNAWGNFAAAQRRGSTDPAEVAKDYRRAVELGQRQLKITPDDPYLVSCLGSFYASLHETGQALPLLRKSLVLAPDDPDVLELNAESYEALGQRQQALTLLAKALKLGFSPEYVRTVPELKALRHDPHAPLQIRDSN